MEVSPTNNFFTSGQSVASLQNQHQVQTFPILGSNDHGVSLDPPGSDGNKYYTIQRVNGNGGNGKGDGTAGPHKHSLQESDRVKKNSIHRYFLKEEKVKKRAQVSIFLHSGSAFHQYCKREVQPATSPMSLDACIMHVWRHHQHHLFIRALRNIPSEHECIFSVIYLHCAHFIAIFLAKPFTTQNPLISFFRDSGHRLHHV